MGLNRVQVALLVFVILLIVYCGVTEVLWFLARPCIYYAELWLKYFTLLYTIVALILVLYIVRVLPESAFDPTTNFACGECGECKRSHWNICEQDPMPRTHKKCAQSKIIPLTAFIPEFKRLVNLETLVPQLCAKQLLLPDEIEDGLHPHSKRGERITSLLVVLSRKGQEGVDGVIETLTTEETHRGHKELADILKRGYYGIGEKDFEPAQPTSESNDTGDIHSLLQTRPGMNVVKKCSYSVSSTNAQSFIWKDYGLRLHIPDRNTSDGVPLQVQLQTCLAGQFSFPPESELVSAVYHIAASSKLGKPITMEVQHCANIRNHKELACLSIVTVGQSLSLPYQFSYMKKASFSQNSSYGCVQLNHNRLGFVAVVKRKVKRSTIFLSLEVPCRYRLQVIYTQAASENEWIAHLIITKDLEPWLQVVKLHYPQDQSVVGISREIAFSKDIISPVIPGEGVSLPSGWKIMPPLGPGVSKQMVEGTREDGLLTECQIRLKWTSQSEPTTLDYRVDLRGAAKQPLNYFRIHLNPTSISFKKVVASLWT